MSNNNKAVTSFHIRIERNYRVDFPDDVAYECQHVELDIWANSINEAIEKAWAIVSLDKNFYEVVYASTDAFYDPYNNRR